MTLPFDAVAGAPDVVEIFACRGLRRVVGAAAENPDTAPEHGTAADHAALRPEWLLWLDLGPADTILGGPHISVENFVCRGEAWNRLATDHPDPVFEGERVVQGARAPGDRLASVDVLPGFPVAGVPHIGMVMALVNVPADNPHLVAMHNRTDGLQSFPVPSRIEGPVEKRIGLVEPPILAVGGAPDSVVADARKVFLVGGVPAAEEPHAALKRQRPRSIAGGKRCLRRHALPGVHRHARHAHNLHRRLQSLSLRRRRLDGSDHIHALDYPPERGEALPVRVALAAKIQLGLSADAEEEIAGGGVRTVAGHRDRAVLVGQLRIAGALELDRRKLDPGLVRAHPSLD